MSHSSRGWKSTFKAPADLVSGASHFLLYRRPSSYLIFIWWVGKGSSVESLLQGHLSYSWGLHTHDLITSKMLYLLTPSHWGLDFKLYEWGGDVRTNIHNVAVIMEHLWVDCKMCRNFSLIGNYDICLTQPVLETDRFSEEVTHS